MARNYTDEPLVGGDTGVWGDPELIQNRLALPINTIRLYDDSGTLKAYAGKCGLIDNSKYGVCHNTTVYTVSLAAITNGNWFKIEVERSGSSSFTMTASDTDTGTDTDPGQLPGNFLSNYDHEKGGFYINSDKRTIALGWANSSGTLEGIINCGHGYNIEGYSITDDALNQYYKWKLNIDDTFDPNHTGRLYILQEDERPNAFVLNGGVQTSFTDVDFSAYVPSGVKALLLYIQLNWTGNGALDFAIIYTRQNGSSETDTIRLSTLQIGYTNLGAGVIMKGSTIAKVLCDSDGLIEYTVNNAATAAYITIMGYYMEDNVA
jgi:hypothetical protein